MSHTEKNEPDVVAHDMSADGLERRLTSIEVRQGDVVRRLELIEKTNPQIVAQQLSDMNDDVKSLKRAFYTFGFTIIGGSVMFAFAVFELLGTK